MMKSIAVFIYGAAVLASVQGVAVEHKHRQSFPTSSKKGLGYNTASYTDAFEDSISWVYNWGDHQDTTTGTLNAGVEFIPMLWGTDASTWTANAQAAIDAGATHLLGFNEPDNAGQSNISPADAAALWLEYIEPFASQAKLVSPAITNGGAPSGVTWMQDFLGNCTTCTIDAIAMHWYDTAVNWCYFTGYFTDAAATFNKPLWITEFMGSGTVDQQESFLNYVNPWLETQSFVERYAAFGDFSGTFVNDDGSLTALGTVYAEATQPPAGYNSSCTSNS